MLSEHPSPDRNRKVPNELHFATAQVPFLGTSEEHPEDEGELPEPVVPEGLFDTPWPEEGDLESEGSTEPTTPTTPEEEPESEESTEPTTPSTPFA